MARTLMAISLMTFGAALAIVLVTAAGAYTINEHCTEQMAWNGNC